MNEQVWKELSNRAWKARDNAYLIGKTNVGCALLAVDNNIYVGCNVEHKFRCHDVHAEVNAITNMIVNGIQNFSVILITAKRHKFTPCGGCMDWIMQHGGENCIVAYQNEEDGPINKFLAKDLMPHYPN